MERLGDSRIALKCCPNRRYRSRFLTQYRSIGFTGGTFCDLLGNLPCEYRLVPVLVCWLQIEGLLWEGVFYDGDVRKYASLPA